MEGLKKNIHRPFELASNLATFKKPTELFYEKNYLYKRIVKAKLFIDGNYAHKIDMNDIAEEAFFSKFHFIRLFKQVYGRTAYQYLTFVRLNKATALLRNSQPIADVCHAVGFETMSAFGSLFKRRTGLTPSAFLDLEQERRKQMAGNPLSFVPGCVVYQHGLNEK